MIDRILTNLSVESLLQISNAMWREEEFGMKRNNLGKSIKSNVVGTKDKRKESKEIYLR